jgi:GNAT superfamily N-acetyltransferase
MLMLNRMLGEQNDECRDCKKGRHFFGPMADDLSFIVVLENILIVCSAFCVRESNGPPGSNLLGGVLFSSSNAPSYKIGWLSVSAQSRGKGVATALLNHILSLIQAPSEVSVITLMISPTVNLQESCIKSLGLFL